MAVEFRMPKKMKKSCIVCLTQAWQTIFSSFLLQKSLCLTFKHGTHRRSTNVCMYKHVFFVCHPRALSHFLFPLPPYFCHASCIRSIPSPVLLSCTYNLSSLWSVPSLFFCPTHIFKPHRKESFNTHQTPHTNCVNSLFQ